MKGGQARARRYWIETLCIDFLAPWPHAELVDANYGGMVRNFLAGWEWQQLFGLEMPMVQE